MSFPKPFYRWRPHPWHGLQPGDGSPQIVNAFIEITSFDAVKYEIDKETGYLRVDRPQRTSSLPPALYGFIPGTLCGERVGKMSPDAKKGDNDPLDICVLSERPINRSEVILTARVVGCIKMIDGDEADDKIIATLHNDNIYESAKDIKDLPPVLVERLEHYFSTYKILPGKPATTKIDNIVGAKEASEIIKASIEDYKSVFGEG